MPTLEATPSDARHPRWTPIFAFRLKVSPEPTSARRYGKPSPPFRPIRRWRVYDINNNQLAGAAFIGTVGLEWQFAGIAPIHAAGASDLVLRNVNTGAFEVYDIVNNQLTGAACI
jgi:hypothetical protein